jgi:hypothetical protein
MHNSAGGRARLLVLAGKPDSVRGELDVRALERALQRCRARLVRPDVK